MLLPGTTQRVCQLIQKITVSSLKALLQFYLACKETSQVGFCSWHLQFIRQPGRHTEALMFLRCHTTLTLKFTSFCWHKLKLCETSEHTWLEDFDEVYSTIPLTGTFQCWCILRADSTVGGEWISAVLGNADGLRGEIMVQAARGWSWMR